MRHIPWRISSDMQDTDFKGDLYIPPVIGHGFGTSVCVVSTKQMTTIQLHASQRVYSVQVLVLVRKVHYYFTKVFSYIHANACNALE